MSNVPIIQAVDAWHEFVRIVMPRRLGTTIALAEQTPDETFDREIYESEGIDPNIARANRRMRNKGRPLPTTVWKKADALQRIVGTFWCAGPLLLFAADYFDIYAKLLIDADEKIIPLRRKFALLEATIPSITFTVRSLEDEINDIKRSNLSDVAKQKLIRKHRRRGLTDIDFDTDRRTWWLRSDENAAFEDLFLKIVPSMATPVNSGRKGWHPPVLLVDDEKPAIVTCALARRHPEIGVHMQRQITIEALRPTLTPISGFRPKG